MKRTLCCSANRANVWATRRCRALPWPHPQSPNVTKLNPSASALIGSTRDAKCQPPRSLMSIAPWQSETTQSKIASVEAQWRPTILWIAAARLLCSMLSVFPSCPSAAASVTRTVRVRVQLAAFWGPARRFKATTKNLNDVPHPERQEDLDEEHRAHLSDLFQLFSLSDAFAARACSRARTRHSQIDADINRKSIRIHSTAYVSVHVN